MSYGGAVKYSAAFREALELASAGVVAAGDYCLVEVHSSVPAESVSG